MDKDAPVARPLLEVQGLTRRYSADREPVRSGIDRLLAAQDAGAVVRAATGLLEAMDAGSAVSHNGGDDTYSTYYQPGIVTHEIIGAAQIDGHGRTNNLELTKPSGGKLRLPGQGGMSARQMGWIVVSQRAYNRQLVGTLGQSTKVL